jgi:hypothetical protein
MSRELLIASRSETIISYVEGSRKCWALDSAILQLSDFDIVLLWEKPPNTHGVTAGHPP